MSTLITTCPSCDCVHEEDKDATWVQCPRCGHKYDPWAEDHMGDAGPEPDYGGAFDGHTVTSDADPGL